MNNFDLLMGKVYDREKYNCAHFAAEIWRAETGEDLLPLLLPIASFKNSIPRELLKLFNRQTEAPVYKALAIVIMRSPGRVPHMGVYIRGKVIHLHERGPERLAPGVATMGFKETLYYVRNF